MCMKWLKVIRFPMYHPWPLGKHIKGGGGGGGGGELVHVRAVLKLVFIINPRRMREGYGSRSFCLSVPRLSVCYHTSCYIPRF